MYPTSRMRTGPNGTAEPLGMADTGHVRSWRGESANLNNGRAKTNGSDKFLGLVAGALTHQLAMSDPEASRIALGMLRWIGRQAGGAALYCPKTLRADILARDAAIRLEFDGRNRAELCRRYGISRSTFYRVLGRER